MIIFPSPPAADPLHIFSPDSPINPAFMRKLLDTAIVTQPFPADASPDRHTDHRLATMHAAASHPADALEAMLAGQMVAANAGMMRCFTLATDPDADKAEARRDRAQAASMIRCTQAMLRNFQRRQDVRRKEDEQPSERAGYWFRDVSVPAPEDCPSAAGDSQPGAFDKLNPMQSGDATPAAAPGPTGDVPPRPAPQASGSPENPMHHEEPATPRLNPMQSGEAICLPDSAPPRSTRPAASAREDPTHSLPPGTGPGGEATTPLRSTEPSFYPAEASPRRFNPMPSEEPDLPDRMTTGDAMMRFASRRLAPNESVEAAWARSEAEAAAEEAKPKRTATPMRQHPMRGENRSATTRAVPLPGGTVRHAAKQERLCHRCTRMGRRPAPVHSQNRNHCTRRAAPMRPAQSHLGSICVHLWQNLSCFDARRTTPPATPASTGQQTPSLPIASAEEAEACR